MFSYSFQNVGLISLLFNQCVTKVLECNREVPFFFVWIMSWQKLWTLDEQFSINVTTYKSFDVAND